MGNKRTDNAAKDAIPSYSRGFYRKKVLMLFNKNKKKMWQKKQRVIYKRLLKIKLLIEELES